MENVSVFLTNGAQTLECDVVEADESNAEFTYAAGLADGAWFIYIQNPDGVQSNQLPVTIATGSNAPTPTYAQKFLGSPGTNKQIEVRNWTPAQGLI